MARGQGQVPDVFQWRGDMSGKPLSSLEGYVTQSGGARIVTALCVLPPPASVPAR